jgi:hypothetical protein
MTTMSLEQRVEASSMLHRVIGFAKQGTMPHETIAVRAIQRLQELAEAQAFSAESVSTARRVLEALKSGVLPTVAACAEAMGEVNEFRLNWLRESRSVATAREGEASTAPPRERG